MSQSLMIRFYTTNAHPEWYAFCCDVSLVLFCNGKSPLEEISFGRRAWQREKEGVFVDLSTKYLQFVDICGNL